MNPEELRSIRARLESYESRLAQGFRTWVKQLLAHIPISLVQRAVETGQSAELLDTIKASEPYQPDLAEVYLAEGRAAMEEVPTNRGIDLPFNVLDASFERAVYDQGAFLIREIDAETRKAIQTVIVNARRDGLHPAVFAPQIRDLIGLTTRQAIAVENQLNMMMAAGVPTANAQVAADRYAQRLLQQRSETIARTETSRATNISRRAAYEQAAQHGLFDSSTAWLEWISVQEDPQEQCFKLNGTRVRFGQEFPDGDPPLHPCCRCIVVAVYG